MRTRGAVQATSNAAVDCDLCHERKGRNATVIHILSFTELDILGAHLKSVFPKSDYTVGWFVTFWTMVHRIYGNEAKQKWVPLWLMYLEVHGVTVKNRSAAIMKHRGHENYSGDEQNLP